MKMTEQERKLKVASVAY